MRIVAFVYDFPHKKSCDGLFALRAHGYRSVRCVASPFKELFVPKSRVRVAPQLLNFHPKLVAESLGYDYCVIDHDDPRIGKFLFGFDVGIILGARVLKGCALGHVPIINMHPGILPYNRGLDNLKWAILDWLPQGVTTHFIDQFVDRGTLIDRSTIPVLRDDTLLDIFLRLQNKEIFMMIDALAKIECCHNFVKTPLGKGKYNSALTELEDKRMLRAFDSYKEHYHDVVSPYMSLFGDQDE